MASIRKDFEIDAPPATVWDAVRDAGAVHRVLMPGVITTTHLEDGARSCTMADGSPLRELIVDIDDVARRFVYSIVEAPMPMTHHSASMEVLAGAEGRTRFVWISDFLPSDLAGPMEGLIEGAVVNIKETLGANAVAARG